MVGVMQGIRITIEEMEKAYPEMVKGQKWRGVKSKYRFICKTHGVYRHLYTSHQQGKRCNKCRYIRMANSLVRPNTMYNGLPHNWRIEEKLNINQIKFIAHQNCFYCGSKPKNIRTPQEESSKYHDKLLYQGIDQVIIGKGHRLGNIIPCCFMCNSSKSDHSLKNFCIWWNIHAIRKLSPEKIIKATKIFTKKVRNIK
jgi:hypothetical protein